MKKIENSFAVTGFIGKDAEIRSFETASVARFSIAVSRADKTGEETSYVSAFMGIEAWRKNEALDSFDVLKKGELITVEATLSRKKWTDSKSGEKRNRLKCAGVWPLDSGVLNITDYVTPDPWQAFFGQKRYGADIYDIYGQVIEGQGRLAALRFGGDGDELKRGGKPPVNHVNMSRSRRCR